MGVFGRVCAAAGMLFATALLAACTSASPEPSSVPPASSTAPSSAAPTTAPPVEAEPELVVDGTASENLPYFDLVNNQLNDGNPGGRPIIDNLIAAGFDQAAMQVTADTTPLGSKVDSLQFAVQLGDECLIGQVGAGGYTSVVGDALSSGGCLIGQTQPINW